MATSAITYIFPFTEALRIRVEQLAALCLFARSKVQMTSPHTQLHKVKTRVRGPLQPTSHMTFSCRKVSQRWFFFFFFFKINIKCNKKKSNVPTYPSTCYVLTLWQSLVWVAVWTCVLFAACWGLGWGMWGGIRWCSADWGLSRGSCLQLRITPPTLSAATLSCAQMWWDHTLHTFGPDW